MKRYHEQIGIEHFYIGVYLDFPGGSKPVASPRGEESAGGDGKVRANEGGTVTQAK